MNPPFSSRLAWQQPLNAWTELLAAKRAAGARLIDLTESNPTRVGIPYPADELRAALADPGSLTYEPSPRGWRGAVEAVAADHARRGFAVDPERILLTASTSEAYGFLFKLLCDPGDVVLVPQPSYPLFDFLVALEGLRLARYPLVWDGAWTVDLDAVAALLDEEPRVRALLIVSPNNPTGSYLKRAELQGLASLAARRGVALVCDEVFAEYPASDTPDPRRVALAAAEDVEALTFSLGGLSKSAGLPQLKLAWIVAGGPPALVADAMDRLELVADSYLSVSTPVMRATPRILALAEGPRAAIRERVRRNRAYLAASIGQDSPLTLRPAEGGWYAILRYPNTVTDEELALALLRDRGVMAHPGYFFDNPTDQTLLVVSLLPREEDVAAAGLGG